MSKEYPGVQALAPISLTVARGERVALVGPSGSGKTTLLSVLAGMVRPDYGVLSLDGRDLRRMKPGRDLARLVGLVNQGYDLVPHLPVIHNVLAGNLGEWSLFRSVWSLLWPRDRQMAAGVLEQLGIAEKLYQRTSHLSGGELQRLAIARVIVQSPQLILADEPVSSLDPTRAEDMLEILTGLVGASGKTLVASIHSPLLIRKYFSRVIGLREGVLQFDVPTAEVDDKALDRLYALNGNGGNGAGPAVG
ncbi:MAG: hypothetical protein BZY88_20775 [SAR202 cluster bacterium Io17-Chloro-G9]|nr:MAG: hypothetical protein BZY88_20775 [SAR202 cluster bacterium Io17-Chloro-G9]